MFALFDIQFLNNSYKRLIGITVISRILLLKAKHRRRDQLRIAANILENARGGILKTQIMYRANLSFTQLNDYLTFLLDTGLITQVSVDGKDLYRTTPKGVGFLNQHRELLKMMETSTARRSFPIF